MIVCVCHAVSDRHIRQVIAEGARSFEDVQFATGVGTCCGACRDCAQRVVQQQLGAAAEPHACASRAPRELAAA